MVLLTVTGPPGSGKSTACKIIRQRTGLDYIYAGQIFRERAKELGLSLEEFGSLCERDSSFDVDLDMRMLERARSGDAILEGRMIGALCWRDGIPAYKVYVDADPKVRARRVQEREGGDLSIIEDAILERERSERMRYLGLYGLDHMDRKIYDLWVDSSKLTPEGVVDKILERVGI